MAELPEEYRFEEFRKYMCNIETGAAAIVNNEEEQQALPGSGWVEKLLEAGIETCPAQDPRTISQPNIMPGFIRPASAVQGRSGGPSAQVAPAGAGMGDTPTGRRARD